MWRVFLSECVLLLECVLCSENEGVEVLVLSLRERDVTATSKRTHSSKSTHIRK